jgi:hypothetical protein
MNQLSNDASLNSAPASDEERIGYGASNSVIKGDPSTVENRARTLMRHYNQPDEFFRFYCRVVYHLDPHRLVALKEEADTKGRDPARYFNYLVSKELGLGRFKEGRLYDNR